MSYDIFKALHVIFVVTWFAGLFYIFRLFVYHREALDAEPTRRDILIEQFRIMERRLWLAITWPSAILTLGFGLAMIWLNPSLLMMPWMHVKLGFVVLLVMYQFLGQRIYKELQRSAPRWSSTTYRLLNEIPTIILIAVVFLVVLKDHVSWVYGVAGVLGVAVVIAIATRIYKRIREREA
ncbi:MAG: CopD family protein [Flavobacteriales bacterium]|jgi:putative membrane protein